MENSHPDTSGSQINSYVLISSVIFLSLAANHLSTLNNIIADLNLILARDIS